MKIYIGPYNNEQVTNFERDVKIEIDDYDIWNADHTLALIILPVLEKLKKDSTGSHFVENKDVPENLHRPENLSAYEDDENSINRWHYVLDKMIESFRFIIENGTAETYENHEKIQEGLRLFGVYFNSLWD